MIFEILTEQKLNDNFGDYTKCENLWKEIDESIVDMFLKMRYKEQDKEVKEHLLLKGESVAVVVGFIRLKTDLPKCPLCGGSYEEHLSSLSIVDNKTKICSSCGTREQLEGYLGVYER